jgi:ABC-type amino acid transport substrate-binding protein
MTERISFLALGSLLVLSAAVIFPSMGSSVPDTYLAEDTGGHLALDFVNAAYAQSDQHMKSKVYLPPAKQLESGTAINDIQCNKPRELYIRQSQTPVCLYAETYDLMQSRGIELVPTVFLPADIFSPEETEWLENNPVIRVSYDPGLVPIEYLDGSGVLQGVTLDYIAEFEAVSGADLVQGPIVETWTDTLKTIKDRESDIMFIVASAPERLEYMSFTSSHYSLKTYMASLNDAPLNIDDDGLVLATIRGYAIESWLDENHPDTQYVSVDNQSEAFEVLQAGGADAFASTWPSVVHYSKLSGVESIYNAGSTGHQYDLTVGYRNDLPILGSIMQKTLDQIPQEKITGWYDMILTPTDVDLTPESIVMGVVDDIIALYDSDPDNAFEQITSMMAIDPHYPFVIDPKTTVILAHGADPEHVGELVESEMVLVQHITDTGSDADESRATPDKPFDLIRAELREHGQAWVEYEYINPITGAEKFKNSLFVLHDGYIFGSGYYTTQDLIVQGVVEDAIALYKNNPDSAFEDINSIMTTDPHYPFVLDPFTTRLVAHGTNPDRVGDVSVSFTASNVPQDVILSEIQNGSVWAEYTFANPLTGEIQSKRSILALYDGYIFGSGYYTTPESTTQNVVDEAIALYISDPDNAFERINSMMSSDPSYPFVIDYNTGLIAAHGSNPGLVNTSSASAVVADRPFDVISSDLLEGYTWVKYIFENPATETKQSKRTLLVLHDGYVFGSGYYTELAPVDIFSPEEIKWLTNNPVIRVSYDPGWVPIEYVDESGVLQGVTLNYIAEFEAVSGADLIHAPAVETWTETLKAIEARDSDILFMVASTPERLEYMPSLHLLTYSHLKKWSGWKTIPSYASLMTRGWYQ